jgi:hypothetical protein
MARLTVSSHHAVSRTHRPSSPPQNWHPYSREAESKDLHFSLSFPNASLDTKAVASRYPKASALGLSCP